MAQPWENKAHRIIAALCLQSKQEALARTNHRRKRQLRLQDCCPYAVPQLAQDLIECLNTQDEARAKALFLRHAYSAPQDHEPMG